MGRFRALNTARFRHAVRLAAFRLIEAGLELKPSIESRCHRTS
jgi:hypothetical protein